MQIKYSWSQKTSDKVSLQRWRPNQEADKQMLVSLMEAVGKFRIKKKKRKKRETLVLADLLLISVRTVTELWYSGLSNCLRCLHLILGCSSLAPVLLIQLPSCALWRQMMLVLSLTWETQLQLWLLLALTWVSLGYCEYLDIELVNGQLCSLFSVTLPFKSINHFKKVHPGPRAVV